MKVLHIINTLSKGGAEQLLVNTLPVLAAQTGTTAVLQLSGKHAEKCYEETLQRHGVAVYRLGNGPVRNPFLTWRLKRFLENADFDIVHVHLFPSLYWVSLAFRLLNKPAPVLIFTEHSTQNKRIHHLLFKYPERFIYRRFDSIVAVSENIKKSLQLWLGPQLPVEVIPNAVSLDAINSTLPFTTAEMPSFIGQPAGKFMVLMAARFSYPKDHATVLQALTLLPANVEVIFAGEGENRQRMMALAERLQVKDRAHFPGHLSNITRLMKTVQLNLLSSYYEGMSGAAIESMASGVPFIGSDVAGINDVVPGKDFLVPAADAKALAAKILQVSADASLYRRLKEQALAHVQQYDMTVMVNRHIALYKKLSGVADAVKPLPDLP